MAPKMFSALVCCYTAFDLEDIKLLIKQNSECLCVTQDCCLAVGDNGYGVGLVTASDEICKLALVVCQCGLKVPKVLVAGASHCLCIKQGHALPFDGKFGVGEPLCAICFVQLLPKVGICENAPEASFMVR
mmetsp:Transcript_24575/g.40216  ORF Transcript_24575/g.40216 Transcript_24575/m.40216 type:complete len:131 (-) Transcript_24575:429-821(-)